MGCYFRCKWTVSKHNSSKQDSTICLPDIYTLLGLFIWYNFFFSCERHSTRLLFIQYSTYWLSVNMYVCSVALLGFQINTAYPWKNMTLVETRFLDKEQNKLSKHLQKQSKHLVLAIIVQVFKGIVGMCIYGYLRSMFYPDHCIWFEGESVESARHRCCRWSDFDTSLCFVETQTHSQLINRHHPFTASHSDFGFYLFLHSSCGWTFGCCLLTCWLGAWLT